MKNVTKEVTRKVLLQQTRANVDEATLAMLPELREYVRFARAYRAGDAIAYDAIEEIHVNERDHIIVIFFAYPIDCEACEQVTSLVIDQYAKITSLRTNEN